MTKYTPEVIEYLKKNSDTPLKKQLKELEELFGLEITYYALSCIRQKIGIKSSFVFYDTEVLDWIKKNADLKIDKQVELIKNQFGVNVSKQQIISARLHYGIKSSVHFNSIFTKEIIDDFVNDTQIVANDMYKSSLDSRRKDFTDYYRMMTYRNTDEMLNVLGKLENNDFLITLEKDTKEFIKNLKETFYEEQSNSILRQ